MLEPITIKDQNLQSEALALYQLIKQQLEELDSPEIIDKIQDFVNAGGNINCKFDFDHGNTFLHVASNSETIFKLLCNHADPNQLNNDGFPSFAIEKNPKHISGYIWNAGLDINILNGFCNSDNYICTQEDNDVKQMLTNLKNYFSAPEGVSLRTYIDDETIKKFNEDEYDIAITLLLNFQLKKCDNRLEYIKKAVNGLKVTSNCNSFAETFQLSILDYDQLELLKKSPTLSSLLTPEDKLLLKKQLDDILDTYDWENNNDMREEIEGYKEFLDSLPNTANNDDMLLCISGQEGEYS